MDDIVYSNNPNEDSVQAMLEGKYRKVSLMRSIGDADVIYQDNPNVGKVLFTGEDGKKHTALLVMDINGGGGGVDTNKVLNVDALPVASADIEGKFYLYNGATDANYTHGYIYECVRHATHTATVSFEPATISGTTVTCSAADFGAFLDGIMSDPMALTHGTMTYDSMSSLWVFVGKDADEQTIKTYQVYQTDYEGAGFVFTGTPANGDVVVFTCSVEEDVVSYAWERVNAQPVPTAEEIGATTSKAHPTTLLASNWSSNTYTANVTGVTATNTVIVAPNASSNDDYVAAGIKCTAQAANQLTFTCDTTPTNNIGINILIINS